jgi:tetratricopeptide (TPR) repeat protein
MRACLIALTVLIWPSLARAGLYIENRAEPGLAIPADKARATILGLRAAAVEPQGALHPESPRALYEGQVRELEQKRQSGAFSPVERANLGGCLIRLGRAREAIQVLQEGRATDHFLVLAHLATAYFVQGELSLAIRHQERLLQSWPAVWPGWNRQWLAWCRECERAFLRLMHSRAAEALRKPSEAGLDPLFPGVRYVGADGKYKAGEIARRYSDLLPSRAIDVTLQLCLWLPADLRLIWQLGELFNAGGHVELAEKILSDLLWGGANFKDLHEHRNVLSRALPVMKSLREGDLWIDLFCVSQALPLPNLAPGAAGPAGRAATAWAAMVGRAELKRQWQQRGQPNLDAFKIQAPEPPPAEAAPMPFNWRHLAVSFAFGAVATMLIGLQWREWQRRRARRLPEPANGEEVVAASDERLAGPPVPPGPS